MTVKTRLSYEKLRRTTRNRAYVSGNLSEFTRSLANCSSDTGRCTEFTEHFTQCARPFASCSAGFSQGNRWFHDVVIALRSDTKFGNRGLNCSLVAIGSPRHNIFDHLTLNVVIDLDNVAFATKRRLFKLGVTVHADHDLLATFNTAGALGH